MQNILVLGAGGDVGQGIVRQLLDQGHRVAAAGRSRDRLEMLAQSLHHENLALLPGGVTDQTEADGLASQVITLLGRIDAVIASINLPAEQCLLRNLTLDAFTALMRGNVGTHLVSAQTFIPLIRPGGLYLAIGGGTADFVWNGLNHVGIAQAAQRRMFMALAEEYKDSGVRIQELMIQSIVAGVSNRAKARPEWLTDDEIGRYACAILERPEMFEETIIKLARRAQVDALG